MIPDHSRRYLTIRILYPKPEHREEILAAVRRVSEAAREFAGLVEIGAWTDPENDRIVNVSLWESKEQALSATAAMHPQFADIPWSEWERRPAENFLGLSRAI
ncbi:MAG TPA: antibiotic biosynthesis monooxygenase [Acidobacteriota bacterium]|nr:antibiotic biosynthesis monooxygenase [Acidobacteriota bacterium]